MLELIQFVGQDAPHFWGAMAMIFMLGMFAVLVGIAINIARSN